MDTTKCAEFGREYLECRMDKYVVTLFLHLLSLRAFALSSLSDNPSALPHQWQGVDGQDRRR